MCKPVISFKKLQLRQCASNNMHVPVMVTVNFSRVAPMENTLPGSGDNFLEMATTRASVVPF